VGVIPIATLDTTTPDAPVFQHGELLPAYEFTNVRGTVDAGEIFRAVGFVMCPAPWREIVLLAVRTVLYRRSVDFELDALSLHTPSPTEQTEIEENLHAATVDRVRVRPLSLLDTNAIVRRVGASRDIIRRLDTAAADAGYFDDYCVLARAPETAEAAVQQIASRYHQFDGEGGWRVSAGSAAAFLSQFPPKLRSPLVEALTRGVYLNQEQLSGGIARAVRKIKSDTGRRIVLTPLSPSSGPGTLATARGLLLGSPFEIAYDLKGAIEVAGDGDLIVFVDDNSASGTQASAQLYAWSAKPRSEWPENLQSETGIFGPINSIDFDALRHKSFCVAVAAGHPRAADCISGVARDLGLNFEGLTFDTEIGAKYSWDNDLKHWLELTGCDLVAQDQFGKAFDALSVAEKIVCEDRAFGYGRIGGLTVLPFNVPTSTVTALWMPGDVRGRPWVPLFLRRGRLKNVVFV
jgi:hypothetical protein